MTKKESRREAKRQRVVAGVQSKIDRMKKTSEENKVSTDRIAEKERNMLNHYGNLFGPRFQDYA
jgi:hypothetical protein